jgi:hypothetical protein
VVPFGLPDRAPRWDEPALKGVHPAVAEDDLVVLWGGGTWDWLDPLTVVEAFNLVVQRVPKAKLYFLGRQLAGAGVPEMRMGDRALARAEELGLAGKSVIFGDWAPYEQREAFLLEADVAVTAARDVAETRLAFRSRVLDYLWAGLPVVCTDGDILAEEVRNNQAGITVRPGDPIRLAEALIRLLENPLLRAECSASALQLAAKYEWRSTVEPLRRLVREPWRWRVSRRVRAHSRDVTEDAQVMMRMDSRHIKELDELVARTHDHLQVRLDEVDALRTYVGELEATVAHQDKRLALMRKTPIMPVFRRAKRLLRGRGPAA